MSASAAATLAHDLARVRAWGITVVDDDEAEVLELHIGGKQPVRADDNIHAAFTD